MTSHVHTVDHSQSRIRILSVSHGCCPVRNLFPVLLHALLHAVTNISAAILGQCVDPDYWSPPYAMTALLCFSHSIDVSLCLDAITLSLSHSHSLSHTLSHSHTLSFSLYLLYYLLLFHFLPITHTHT